MKAGQKCMYKVITVFFLTLAMSFGTSSNVFATGIEASLDNDTFETATQIQEKNLIQAEINLAGDDDYYVFTPTVSEKYRISIAGESIFGSYLYDQNQVKLEYHFNDYNFLDNIIEYQLEAGQKYYIKVTSGTGLYGLWVAPNSSIPNDPSNLTSTVVSGTEIDLSWTDNSVNETGFSIERETYSYNNWTTIGIVEANTTTFRDTGISPNTGYFYRVKALNGGVNSRYGVIPTPVSTYVSLDYNDTFETATLITENHSIESEIYTGGDIDFYKFIPTKNGVYQISSKDHVRGSLYDNNGLPVPGYGIGGSFQMTYSLNAGQVYYIRVVYDGFLIYTYDLLAYELMVTSLSDIPNYPTNLVAILASGTEVDLNWTDNSSNETGFIIERSQKDSNNWFTIVGTVAPNTTTFRDTGLSPDSTYVYQIKAINDELSSSYSSTRVRVYISLDNNDTFKTATPIQENTLIQAEINPYGDSDYYSFTTTTSGRYRIIGSSYANVIGYLYDGNKKLLAYNYYRSNNDNKMEYLLESGLTYYVNVVPQDLDYSKGAYSFVVAPLSSIPKEPTDLQARVVSSTEVELNWIDNSENETGFIIERKMSSDYTWSNIGTLAVNTTTYKDTGLSPENTYLYRVKAVNNAASSEYLQTTVRVYVSLDHNDTFEAATPIQENTLTQAEINPLGDVDYYKFTPAISGLYRIYSTGDTELDGYLFDNNQVELKNTENYSSLFIEQQLYEGQTYFIMVKYSNGYRTGAYNIAFSCIPNAPTNLKANVISGTEVELFWEDNSTNETGFIIERNQFYKSTWSTIATLPSNTATYRDTGLSPNTNYWYRVRAINNAVSSSNSYLEDLIVYDSLDHNDSFETATPIQENTIVQAEINPAGEPDFYIFSPIVSGAYRISTGGNFVFNLYDSNQMQMEDNNYWHNSSIPGSLKTGYLEYPLEAGKTYYIKVWHPAVNGKGAYGLVLTNISATPLVRIGINPDKEDSAGIFVGLKDIRDTGGNLVPDTKLVSYHIDVYFDHNQAKVLGVYDQAHFGKFTFDSGTPNLVSLADTSYQGTSNYEKLFFIPFVVTGSSSNSTDVLIRFTSITDSNFNFINVPDVILTFQRGKMINEASKQSLSIADAVAGLQYLAKIVDAGTEQCDVNVVNMASILQPEAGAKSIKPSVKDVIALMQKLAGLRDDTFQLYSY